MSVCLSQTVEPLLSLGPRREIASLDRAVLALAQADTLDEIKQIRDKAEAVRKYARSAALGHEVQNHAAELKLRAERKAGELLRSLRLRGGDRKSDSRNASLKLDDLGINKDQSARRQLQSQLPVDQFETYLRTTREAGGDLVAADVLRLASAIVKNRRTARPQPPLTGTAQASRSGAGPLPSAPAAGRYCRRIVGQAPRREDMLADLENHCGLLDNILRPVYSGTSNETVLRPAERRVLGRLLAEMRSMLEALNHPKL